MIVKSTECSARFTLAAEEQAIMLLTAASPAHAGEGDRAVPSKTVCHARSLMKAALVHAADLPLGLLTCFDQRWLM